MGNFLLLCLPFLLINLIQTTLFTNGPLRSLGYPDFNLLIVIFSGLTFSRAKTLEIAFAAGLMREFFSSGGFGADIIVMMMIGFLTSTMQEKIYQENPFTLAGSIFAIAVIAQLGFATVDYHSLLLPASAWGSLFGIAIISGLVAIPMAVIWQKTFPKRKKYY